MNPVRCPSCAAVVPVGAPWCTLCWADLRPPAPADEDPLASRLDPLREPEELAPFGASLPLPGLSALGGFAPTVGLAPPPPVTLPPVPAVHPVTGTPDSGTRPAGTEPGAEPGTEPGAELGAGSSKGWPCRVCGRLVDFERPSCPDCGSPFLTPADLGEPAPGTGSRRITDLTAGSRGRTAAIAVGGAAACTALFLLVALVLGSLF